MKILSTLCLVLFLGSFLVSCGSTRRTKCRGNGSWSGNRNLSLTKQQANDIVCQTTNKETVIAFH